MEIYFEFFALVRLLERSFGLSHQDAVVSAGALWIKHFPQDEPAARCAVQREGWDAAASLQRRLG